MRREIQKQNNFKKELRFILAAFLLPFCAILALGLLCLGRELMKDGDAEPSSSIRWPLAAVDTATASLPEAAGSNGAGQEGTGRSDQWDDSVTLTVLIGGEERTMTLGDYLWGVVAAEMPAGFEQQALNAQAAAARTYTVYQMLHHTAAHAADLCDDVGCCQAWISREERAEKWAGEDADALSAKITQAVADTDGMAVCYEGAPIQALFHAASAAFTRSAAEVFGEELPYLQSVESPEGDEVPNYYSVVTVPSTEFVEKLTAAAPGCDFSGDSSGWIGPTVYDAAGLSTAVQIGGQEVPTRTLRTLFSLRSSSLSVEMRDGNAVFYVTGYGHGVGMSQYGANALAKQGKSWQEILTWYYSGTDVENLADKNLDLG